MRLLSYIAGRVGARIRRAPGLHFLLLGALLFAAQGWRTPASAPPKRAPIVLSAADLERWRREWPARAGIDAPPPSDAVLVDAAIDDAVLLREALERAYDRRDPVVRARLLTLGRYLGLAAGGADEAIEREARALGLQRSDEVVRRHLVEMMRLAAAKAGPGDLPTEADLRAYYAQHRDRFAQGARTQLTHVYLSSDRRADRLDADAAELLRRLRDDAVDPAAASALGDPFTRGAHVPAATSAQLDQAFGAGFAAAVDGLSEHTWSGPVRSAYGLHLIWIEDRLPAATPDFEAVRNRILHQYMSEHSQTRLQDRLRTWRARYDVRIEE